MSDGVLRKQGDRYVGILNGYRVEVYRLVTRWVLWIGHPPPKVYTLISCEVRSPRDGARQARAWIDAHPLWNPT